MIVGTEMAPSAIFVLIVLGSGYALLMMFHELAVLPALRAHFAADGARGARRRQRKFEWACRQAVSYFYSTLSLQSLRNLPLSLGEDFGPLVTCVHIGLLVMCALCVWLAWYRWEHAREN